MFVMRRARLAGIAVALLASIACSHMQDHQPVNGNASTAQPAANANATPTSAANTNAAITSKPGTGSIEIISVPPGAGITLMPTGEESVGAPLSYGPTPATINDLAPGKYTLNLHQTGYKEFRREVEIKAGSAVKVNAALKK